LKTSFIIFGVATVLFFSGCSGIFSENSSALNKQAKFAKSFDREIPQAKVRPCAYSGILKHCDSFWLLPFWKPNYDYCIADIKGNTITFLDISDLAMGISLANFIDKMVTVHGQTFPHKHRGIIVVKAKHLVPHETKKLTP
jgi:hypothetical protein